MNEEQTIAKILAKLHPAQFMAPGVYLLSEQVLSEVIQIAHTAGKCEGADILHRDITEALAGR